MLSSSFLSFQSKVQSSLIADPLSKKLGAISNTSFVPGFFVMRQNLRLNPVWPVCLMHHIGLIQMILWVCCQSWPKQGLNWKFQTFFFALHWSTHNDLEQVPVYYVAKKYLLVPNFATHVKYKTSQSLHKFPFIQQSAIHKELRGSQKAITPFIKIPTHFYLSLSCNHGNHVISPHTPADVFSLQCVLLQRLKKMTLKLFSCFVLHQHFSHISFPLYRALLTHLSLSLFSPLSLLYLPLLLLLSTPIFWTHTPLTNSFPFLFHAAPVREERQPEQLPAQCVQPSQHPHRFSQPPTLCHAQWGRGSHSCCPHPASARPASSGPCRWHPHPREEARPL